MTEYTYGTAAINARVGRIVPLLLATAAIGLASPAHATGTAAGTVISNAAEVTYTSPGGTPVTVPSNAPQIRVDEVLNVTVVSNDPGDVIVNPGATNQVLSFTATNTGNGPEAFTLASVNALGNDDFDPTTTSLVLDSNNNGVYDAGVDTVYAAGTNNPVLAADASIRVFVLSTVPASATDAQRGQTELTATAVTGSGSPGTSFDGAGEGGGFAVVGTTGGDGSAGGFYLLSDATVSVVKSASVTDELGGIKSVPGATITYTITTTVTGSAALNGLVASDAIPANTTFVPGSIKLDGSALSDAADGDAGETNAGKVIVRLPPHAGGQTVTTTSVTFATKIN